MKSIAIGIIVDGHGDHAALSARFGGKARILKTSGPRGHTVDAKAIVASAMKEVEMLKGLGCKKVCILTDREARKEDADAFNNAMQKFLPVASKQFSIVTTCADRMIENWILADIVEVSRKNKELKSGIKQKSWEGTHGKKELKKCFEKQGSYNEVKHGKKFMLAIRDDVARRNSTSFNRFLALLSL